MSIVICIDAMFCSMLTTEFGVSRIPVREALMQLGGEGWSFRWHTSTILLVEQNARLALRLAHYAYVIENGEIRSQGDAATLREDESIVQAYLGVA